MPRVGSSKYTNQGLIELAQQYKTKSDFIKNQPNQYAAILKRGLRAEAFKHMKPTPSPRLKYSDTDIIKLASSMTSRQFSLKHEHIRAVARKRGSMPKLYEMWEQQSAPAPTAQKTKDY